MLGTRGPGPVGARLFFAALLSTLPVWASCGRHSGSVSRERDDSTVASSLVTDPAIWKTAWRAAPPARAGDQMVYDTDRKLMVTFGGAGNSDVNYRLYQDVWEWNAIRRAWNLRTPSGVSPPARANYVMVYDPLRKRTFLFGVSSVAVDEWEWDGATGTWTQRASTGPQPPARGNAAMVWDSDRQRAVLFGGTYATTPDPFVELNDLWEWDGDTGTWADRTPAGTKPNGRFDHTMAYDSVRKKLVVYGGIYVNSQSLTVSYDETWEWDGATQIWSPGPALGNPPITTGVTAFDLVADARMAFDSSRGKVVLYASDGSEETRQVWEYSPSGSSYAWTKITTTNSAGPGTGSFVYDPDRKLFVVEAPTPWEYDPAAALWSPRVPAGPLGRTSPAVAYDSKAGEVRVFGGNQSSTSLDTQDLWAWPGADGGWDDLTNADPKPPAKSKGAMVYDGKRDRLLLVAGSDIWTWASSTGTWTRTTVSGPGLGGWTPTTSFYDPARDKVLMLAYGAIWEFDPATSTISSRAMALDPLPAGLTQRQSAQFAFDTYRSKLLMFNAAADGGTVWEWDAATGTYAERKPPANAPAPASRTGCGVSFDSARRVVVLVGGEKPTVITDGGLIYPGARLDDSWEWDSVSGTWNETTGSSLPVPLLLFVDPRQVYDSLNARTLIFGRSLPGDWGGTTSLSLNYIWEYRGSTTPRANGAGCSPAGATTCASGNCVDGVCCAQTAAQCSGMCKACDVAGSLGTCSDVPAGLPDDTCPGGYVCDATHACTMPPGLPDGGGADAIVDAIVDATGTGGAGGGGDGPADASVDLMGTGGTGAAVDAPVDRSGAAGTGPDATVDHPGAGGAQGGSGGGNPAGCGCLVGDSPTTMSFVWVILVGIMLTTRKRPISRSGG